MTPSPLPTAPRGTSPTSVFLRVDGLTAPEPKSATTPLRSRHVPMH
jgi:hypothetical protein